MEPKYITIDNYSQFKPSEFVRSFASDVDTLIKLSKKTGKLCDMSSYIGDSECLPCLGGMACLNLTGKEISSTSNIGAGTAYLGNSIRRGDSELINRTVARLYPNFSGVRMDFPLQAFYCIQDDEDLQRLKKQIHKIADCIEASGQ